MRTNIDKLHWTGPYQPNDRTESVIVKLKNYSFKEKRNHSRRKNVNNDIKLVQSLTTRRSQLLNKLLAAFNDNKENGILDTVNFVYADVHDSLQLVLQNPTKWGKFFFNSELEFYQFVEKVSTKRVFLMEDQFKE